MIMRNVKKNCFQGLKRENKLFVNVIGLKKNVWREVR